LRLLSRLLPVLLVGGILAALTWAGAAWNASRVPDRYGLMDFGALELGGGSPVGHAGHDHGRSVADLREPASGPPDVRLTLVAQHAQLRLPSGKTVSALTFNGTVPGPEIRVRLGQLVEVTLVNQDIKEGVSIHWHGLDVPNSEDGVAGLTQDAVPVGGRYVYRFRASQTGTYWYHSHQHSLEEVKRGLYGAFVVAAAPEQAGALDLTLIAHRLPGASLLGASDVVEQAKVAPGTPVRLRLVNSDNATRRFAVAGTAFQVVAIDGGDIYRPAQLRDVSLAIAAGGRYDLSFTMPEGAVSLGLRGGRLGLSLSPDGKAPLSEVRFGPTLDPADYGAPAVGGIAPGARFARSFSIDIDRKLGFFAGGFRLGRQWTLNGRTYPHMPMLAVDRGELVKISFRNNSGADHPMHLHGHHMLVIARDDRPVRTPWLVDTLDLRPGDHYEVAFRAVNPGLWMLHCHDLEHAAHGLMTHLVYPDVWTPYVVGDDTPNTPE
jgi:FtsP/CotA-like multicopper oxidase with cupredoxin domain